MQTRITGKTLAHVVDWLETLGESMDMWDHEVDVSISIDSGDEIEAPPHPYEDEERLPSKVDVCVWLLGESDFITYKDLGLAYRVCNKMGIHPSVMPCAGTNNHDVKTHRGLYCCSNESEVAFVLAATAYSVDTGESVDHLIGEY